MPALGSGCSWVQSPLKTPVPKIRKVEVESSYLAHIGARKAEGSSRPRVTPFVQNVWPGTELFAGDRFGRLNRLKQITIGKLTLVFERLYVCLFKLLPNSTF